MKIALGQAKQNARLGQCLIQVGGRQSAAQDHVAITPILNPANMLLARLVLRLRHGANASQEKHSTVGCDGVRIS